MFLAYGIKDNDSNLIIIGKDGIVKYSFSGRVGEKEFSRIKDLLTAEANPPEFRISLL
jgi:predicted transcriptional regulator